VALPTASAVRTLALPGITGTAEDTTLTTLIAAANAVLARYCLWPANDSDAYTFEASTYTQYYNGPDPGAPHRLTLGLRPVTAITTITQDTAGTYTFSETVTENTHALLDEHNGCLYVYPGSTHAWLTGFRAIKVVMTAGYNTGAEPPLTQAIAFLVAHWWSLRTTTVTPSILSQGGQSSTLRPDDLPASVRQLVAPYRLVERETHWRHA
jgi:hypothetical protein